MRNTLSKEIIDTYFKRFAFQPSRIQIPAHQDTDLIIVVPCYHEPNLLQTLQSLADCQSTHVTVEVIIVLNASEKSGKEVLAQNEKTCNEATDWIGKNEKKKLRFLIIRSEELPHKHAGVGLARKIGMDEALWRFGQIGKDGAIVCLDADCKVSPNYLIALEETFADEKTGIATIYFEHEYDLLSDTGLRDGIIHYELFLRYYIRGLIFANFPFSAHTVGSSMACRASIYGKTGGMNRRKAGEDFYFLHKVLPHGRSKAINQATVFPASRISERVPFGTGKAQQDWLNQESKIKESYHPDIFKEIGKFLEKRESFYEPGSSSKLLKGIHPSIAGFLEEQNFPEAMETIIANSASKTAIEKKFFHWLDGFRVMKMVHYARDHHFGEVPLALGAKRLLEMIGNMPEKSAEGLLKQYRELDRKVH